MKYKRMDLKGLLCFTFKMKSLKSGQSVATPSLRVVTTPFLDISIDYNLIFYAASKSRVMTGLSVALSLALVILLLTTLITCFLLVTNQRARHKRNSTITQSGI